MMSSRLFALALLACSTKTLGGAGEGGHGGESSHAGNGATQSDGGGANGDAARGGAPPGGGGATGGGTAGGAAGDTSLFVPANLPNTTVAGEDTALTLVAFTLVKGASGLELYAAARNDGTTPVCEPGMLTSFFDQSGMLVTSVGSTLQTAQFYALDDGTVIPCVDPGSVAMSGSTGLPSDIVVAQLGHLEHAFPAFVVSGITPVAGLGISALGTAKTLDGTTYTGTLTNGLAAPATNATVTVFPLNAAGRPLSMAVANATDAIPAGGSWAFQTNLVHDAGVAQAAYPSD
ncbi:MAG TPA: FxLYD domain-containing protein [Polyangiaceae bacterium]|nr:FxLYD domain-containing protein [Polyangiaceae bacterium]